MIRKTDSPGDTLIGAVLFVAALLAAAVSLSLIGMLAAGSIEFFREVSLFEFFTGTVWNPLFFQKQFGILPLVTGTLSVVIIAVLVSVGPGILISIYLSEFASDSLRNIMLTVLEIVSGIPTVVYGFLTLFWATPVLKKLVPGFPAFSAFSVGIMTGLMVLPVLIYLWEAVISSVSDRYRQGSLMLGADRMQTLFRAVLPAAMPGLLSVLILAIIRVIGETMIVVIAGGQKAEFGFDFLAPIQTMTAFIIQVGMGDFPPESMEYQGAFAIAGVLAVTTMSLSLLSRYLRRMFSERSGQ